MKTNSLLRVSSLAAILVLTFNISATNADNQAEPRSSVPMFYLYCTKNDGPQYVTYIGIPALALDGKVDDFKVIFGAKSVYSCGFKDL